jgi:hypothetical protein
MSDQAGLMSGDDIRKAWKAKEILIAPYNPGNTDFCVYYFYKANKGQAVRMTSSSIGGY